MQVSDDGGHLLVTENEIPGDGVQGVLIDLCDNAAARHRVTFHAHRVLGASVNADGTPRTIRVLRQNPGMAWNEHFIYEASVYPGPHVLAFRSADFGAPDLGNGSGRYWAPMDFMSEEPARRFHWIVLPADDSRLTLFTHDFETGTTRRLSAPFPMSPPDGGR